MLTTSQRSGHKLSVGLVAPLMANISICHTDVCCGVHVSACLLCVFSDSQQSQCGLSLRLLFINLLQFQHPQSHFKNLNRKSRMTPLPLQGPEGRSEGEAIRFHIPPPPPIPYSTRPNLLNSDMPSDILELVKSGSINKIYLLFVNYV